MLLASTVPHKENLMRCVEWLTREVEREGVEVKLNTEVTEEAIRKEKPDAVIAASGAMPISRFGYSGPDFFNAWEVLAGKDTGKRVIVLGGGMVGMETAEFLFQKGCEVTVITSRDSVDKLAVDMEPFNQTLFLERLADSNISVIFSAEVLEVSSGQVLFRKDGKKQSLEAETILLAGGSQANNKPSRALEGEVPQLVSIGDCVEPRKAKDAIHEGFFAGLNI
jgi:pyruvate/2-oxoglutarate dehydrogenase complex dihydrolipoamide dehydrogenase (E3) component